MKIKKYKNYITWQDRKGNFNTECNRASLENQLALTIPTSDMTKVANIDGRGLMRIRKLTPTTCMKLMGFTPQDVVAMRQAWLSDMQIYHCAGDSIVTTVLMGIFAEYLGIENYQERIENYIEVEVLTNKD